MSALLGDAYRKVRSLDEALMGAKTVEGSQALANYYRDKVFSAMAELRITIDQLETMTPSDKWPGAVLRRPAVQRAVTTFSLSFSLFFHFHTSVKSIDGEK